MRSLPTRAQIEPHLRQILQDDPEHRRLTAAVHEARAALGTTLTPEVLALMDASTDLVVYASGVEGALLWAAGRAYGAAGGSARGLGGEPDMDATELALQGAVEVLQAR